MNTVSKSQLEMAQKMEFSTNWNRKLWCQTFSSIRLFSDKYQLNGVFEIYNRKGYLGAKQIVHIFSFRLEQLTETMAFLDTGYSRAETIAIIKKIYSKSPIDWSKQPLLYMILSDFRLEK